MFAVASLEPAAVCLAFKCSDESFADLTERPNVIPAPYLARAKWIAMETREAVFRWKTWKNCSRKHTTWRLRN